MNWLTSGPTELAETAVKALLMYVTALVGLRLGERRTLAQWTAIDFATAVAMGAVIGRTAVAQQSYSTGAVAVLTLVLVHRVASALRFNPVFGKLLDHRVRVLVDRGELRERELRRCGVTEHDLYRELRQRGVFDLSGVRYVLYESKGDLSIVRDEVVGQPLVQEGLQASIDFP